MFSSRCRQCKIILEGITEVELLDRESEHYTTSVVEDGRDKIHMCRSFEVVGKKFCGEQVIRHYALDSFEVRTISGRIGERFH